MERAVWGSVSDLGDGILPGREGCASPLAPVSLGYSSLRRGVAFCLEHHFCLPAHTLHASHKALALTSLVWAIGGCVTVDAGDAGK